MHIPRHIFRGRAHFLRPHDGCVPHRNLNWWGRRTRNRLGARLERGRHKARARVYGRGTRKAHGRRLGTDERGEPVLPREGEHAVGPAALNVEETEGRRHGGERVCKCGSLQINNFQFSVSVTIDIGT